VLKFTELLSRATQLGAGLIATGHYARITVRDMTQLSSIGIVSQAVEADTDCDSAGVPLVVFFGACLLDGSAWRVTVALAMVSSVLASHSRHARPSDVRLDVVVERPRDRGYACIEYQGDAFGIVALVGDVRRIWPDGQWQESRQTSGLPR
jgi:hypothetical protein